MRYRPKADHLRRLASNLLHLLFFVAAAIFLFLLALVPANAAPATPFAHLAPAFCQPAPCTNQSVVQPYWQTQQFWAGIGDALIAGGIVTLVLALTVYKHPAAIVGGAILLVAGILVAVFL